METDHTYRYFDYSYAYDRGVDSVPVGMGTSVAINPVSGQTHSVTKILPPGNYCLRGFIKKYGNYKINISLIGGDISYTNNGTSSMAEIEYEFTLTVATEMTLSSLNGTNTNYGMSVAIAYLERV